MNKDYIGAYSLEEGKDLVVTITSASQEEVKGEAGKTDNLLVAKLKDQKPFIINNTNAKTISSVVGSPYIEDWAGKSITLYGSTTRLGRDMVECLRVRDFAPKVEVDTKKAIKLLKTCKTLADLQKNYTSLSRAEQGAEDVVKLKDELKGKLK
jgi:hypothetical protein